MDPGKIRNTIKKIGRYAERNGWEAAAFRLLEGVKESVDDRVYSEEMSMVPAAGNVEEEASDVYLSLIIPVCDPDIDDFAHLLDSLIQQSFTSFEVIIADGGSTGEAEDVIKTYREDPGAGIDIKYYKLTENLGISGNTNEAIKRASGDYLTFIDHDDFLEADALSETVKKIREGALMIYTDEDKYDGRSDRFLSPNRKGDFNLDLLFSNNYICHMLTVKRELVEKAGGFRSGYDGAQDHDLILRLSEMIPREKIAHVPKILYHWRITANSTSGNPDSKLYAYENGKRAVKDYFERRGIGAEIKDTAHMGFYHPDYRNAWTDNSKYLLFIDKKLHPMTPEYEKCLGGYFARDEVGIVGARIIGKTGRTVSNGYRIDQDGRKVPEYGKIDYRFSGYMHRASMTRETEAVSVHAFAIRKSLKDCISRDPFEMCRKVRDQGYLCIVDPYVSFRI